MNSQKLRGRWDQTKGLVKEFWGELTGDDHNFIAGQRDRLIGRLEERYDMTHQEAAKEADKFDRKRFPPEGSTSHQGGG